MNPWHNLGQGALVSSLCWLWGGGVVSCHPFVKKMNFLSNGKAHFRYTLVFTG
jgi:hypothetical protein